MKPIFAELLKGIVICKENGQYLMDLILDSEINPVLLSSFVGALSMFGKGNLGKIEEILIKGLDVDMIVVKKHHLLLIAIIGHEFSQGDIRSEAEKALDMFYNLYKNEIDGCLNVARFSSFKKLLKSQILDYLENLVENSKKERDDGDFGFFTEAIRKMKDHQ